MTKMRRIEQTNKFELVLNLEALGIAVPRDAGDCRILRAQSKRKLHVSLNAAWQLAAEEAEWILIEAARFVCGPVGIQTR